jgi:hypothetical protein
VTDISISAGDARRIALAAQGFRRARPQKADVRHVRKAIEAAGILQIDSVNALCRSHYMAIYSRVGPYRREILDALAGHETTSGRKGSRRTAQRELFEYWAHEASLIPLRYQPLLRWRMERADQDAWTFVSRVAKEQPELIERVLALVAQRGPLRGSEATEKQTPRSARAMWDWSEGKNALEYLFYAGRVTAAKRVNFERFYDLTERVISPTVLAVPTPDEDDAHRQLLLIAAERLGVATEDDLGDYFRLPRKASRARVAELAHGGELVTVAVEGWNAPAYAPRRPTAAGPVRARALLSPFDSLIWSRKRTSRLFGFDYRLEIYTPAAKRTYGYYVLPFLLGEELVARVDLKSDRPANTLRVLGSFAEAGRDDPEVAHELAAELWLLAGWLDLDRVEVARRGDLSRRLARAVDAGE